MNKFKCFDKAEAELIVNAKYNDGFKIGGIFEVECRDADGNLKWFERVHNLVTYEGLDHLLNVHFHGTTQVTTWYVGLKNTGTVANSDILSSHGGWTEFTSYSGDRKEFVEGAASSRTISNTGNAASFSITGSGTVYGAFIASAATGTTGTLFSAVDFSSSRSVGSGDTINVTYTISSADDGV
jgi:hypothetical protein